MIDTYFRAILAMLRASPIVQSHNVTFDKRGPHAGYVRGDVFFADDSQLHFREFVSTQFGADRFVYVYHYQTATVVDDCMAAFGGTDGLAAKATYIFGDDGKIRQVGGMGEGAGWDSYQNWILSATNWMQINRSEEYDKADYDRGRDGALQNAAQLGCETVWSEDLNPGQVYEGVRGVNPFAEQQPRSAI